MKIKLQIMALMLAVSVAGCNNGDKPVDNEMLKEMFCSYVNIFVNCLWIDNLRQ